MKMTRGERNWVLYDVGNSAFVLLVSTIMPLYFNYLAGSAGLSDSDYLAYWGYAASIATIIVAVMGPVAGTMADMKGFKKILFTISMLVGMFQGGVQALSRSFLRRLFRLNRQESTSDLWISAARERHFLAQRLSVWLPRLPEA